MGLNEHLLTYNETLHKEHVDHEGSNKLNNCVPGCKYCNSSKKDFSLEDWYDENNPNFNQERLDSIIKWITEDYKQYIQPTKPKGKYTKKIKNDIT